MLCKLNYRTKLPITISHYVTQLHRNTVRWEDCTSIGKHWLHHACKKQKLRHGPSPQVTGFRGPFSKVNTAHSSIESYPLLFILQNYNCGYFSLSYHWMTPFPKQEAPLFLMSTSKWNTELHGCPRIPLGPHEVKQNGFLRNPNMCSTFSRSCSHQYPTQAKDAQTLPAQLFLKSPTSTEAHRQERVYTHKHTHGHTLAYREKHTHRHRQPHHTQPHTATYVDTDR